MSKKITDNEIKKALECCLKDDCKNCPLVEIEDCVEMTDALDLINRLQAELFGKTEQLETANAEVAVLREIRDLCNTTILEKNEQIEKLKISDASKEECTIKQHGEIKELKAEIESLKRQLHNSQLHQKETYKALQDEKALRLNEDFVKAEAYKEFAEKAIELIKTKAFNLSLMRSLYTDQSSKALYRCAEDIDNLLKEMVGEYI